MTARRIRSALLALLVVGATALCVRLGFWQLARRRYKHALHEHQRALLAQPPVDVASAAAAPPAGRRVRVAGSWDRVHILLSGRTHLGAAGVSLLTPLRLADGGAVLVERGWLPAADAFTAHPEEMGDSTAAITGVVEPLPRSAHPLRWTALTSESAGVALWSARVPEADSAAARVRGPLARWIVRALPESRATPDRGAARAAMVPLVEPLEVPDETMHLSYAIQWFGFAAVIAFGSLSLAVRGARRARGAD